MPSLALIGPMLLSTSLHWLNEGMLLTLVFVPVEFMWQCRDAC